MPHCTLWQSHNFVRKPGVEFEGNSFEENLANHRLKHYRLSLHESYYSVLPLPMAKTVAGNGARSSLKLQLLPMGSIIIRIVDQQN
jgi:hypothetical protein